MTFWICVVIGYAAGAAVSFSGARRTAARIASDSPQSARVRQAGFAAAIVSALPGLFFATVLGGGVGNAAGAYVAGRLTLAGTAGQIVSGSATGIGIFLVLSVIVISTAAAGSTFMKVYLAR